MTDEERILKAVDFFFTETDNFYNLDKGALYDLFKKHIEYKTVLVFFNNDEVVALVRWNLSPDCKVATVDDFIIRKDFRGKKTINMVMKRALQSYPMMEKLYFKRGNYGKKYGHDFKHRSIKRLLQLTGGL